MTQSPLILSMAGVQIEIACTLELAPRTVARVLKHLPRATDTHIGRVADAHVMLPVPLVQDFEGTYAGSIYPAGTVLYYPPRQIVELLFEPTEVFAANVIGRMNDEAVSSEVFARVCEAARRGPLWTFRSDTPARFAGFDPGGMLARLLERPSDDLARMSEIVGELAPVAPALYCESELRKLHEFLWAFRQQADRALACRAAAVLLRSTANQMRGFFGMAASAALIDSLGDLLHRENAPESEVLDYAIVCIGRLSFWAAFALPWHSMNAAGEELRRRIAQVTTNAPRSVEPAPKRTPATSAPDDASVLTHEERQEP